MAQPTPYTPSAEFQELQDGPVGPALDTEFNDLNLTTDEILANLVLIQRDDGQLRNGIVHADSFGSDAFLLFAGGSGTTRYVPRGAWVTARSYAVTDIVTSGGITYFAALMHTSGASFPVDLAAGKWVPIASISDAFVSGAAYAAGRIVSYNGAIYSALNNLSAAITPPDMDATNWRAAGGSSIVSGSFPVVATLAAMKAVGVTPPSQIFILGYYAAGDGGGGAYWYDALDSVADEGVLHISVTGVITGRYRPLIEGRLNVLRGGCYRDNSTDTTARLQACQDTELPLFFPSTGGNGGYKITSAILYDSSVNWMGSGVAGVNSDFALLAGQSTIIGNFATPLVYRRGALVAAGGVIGDPNIGTGCSVVVQCIRFIQNHSLGSCFQTYNVVAPITFISNRFDFVYRGLELYSAFQSGIYNNTFSGSWFSTHPVTEVDVNGNPTYIEAVALRLGTGTASGNNFQGCGTAIRAYGPGCNVYGGRVEVCGRGLQIGGFDEGNQTTYPASAGFFSSLEMEANEDNVHIVSMSNTTVCNIVGGSTTNGPGSNDPARSNDGTGSYGLTIDGSDSFSIVDNITMGGAFRKWAFKNNDTGAQVSRLQNTNTGGYGSSIIDANPTSIMSPAPPTGNANFYGMRTAINAVINNRAAALLDPSDKYATHFGKLYLAGIVQPDYTKPAVYPNNTCGILAVAMSAVSATYTFLTEQSGGNAAFNSAPAGVADGTSTLTAGDYYFAATLVGPRGETGVDITAAGFPNINYKMVTLGALQKASMTLFGADARLKHRVYIGRTRGDFLGYIEFSGASLDYNGQALTGYGVPPANGVNIKSQVEKDANYQIIATPSWGTTCYCDAADRLVGSFTLHFGTAAPSAKNVAWILSRP